MDKETLSNYGWIVICVLVLAVMIALASPFGEFVSGAIKNTSAGLFGVNQEALGAVGIGIADQSFDNSSGAVDDELPADTENIIYHLANVPDGAVEVAADATNMSTIYGGVLPSDLIIPAAYKDGDIWYKVTSINARGFFCNVDLTSVTIPDSVTTIGDSAFNLCEYMTSVTISNSVTFIGNGAFQYCYGLTSITMGDSVTTIGDSAFSYCTNLTSITIPDSVTTIGDNAFVACKLTYVTIPNSVTSIGKCAFKCTGILSITVDANNPNYCSVNGVLFNKDKTILVAYPSAKAATYAIPDSVKTIGFCAFQQCPNLTSVTIPNSVTCIDEFAFCCTNTFITFNGTIAEWNNISNGCPCGEDECHYTIHCTDGCLDKSGNAVTCTCTDHTN